MEGQDSLKVLLLVDGSDESIKVATYAREFAQAHSEQFPVLITILCIRPFPVLIYFTGVQARLPIAALGPISAQRLLIECEETTLEPIKRVFDSTEYIAETKFKFGFLARVARYEMKESQYHLVITGDYGCRTFAAFHFGGISKEIIRWASCPVLIVK